MHLTLLTSKLMKLLELLADLEEQVDSIDLDPAIDLLAIDLAIDRLASRFDHLVTTIDHHTMNPLTTLDSHRYLS